MMFRVAPREDRDDRLPERRPALGTRRARRLAALPAALVIAGAILGASALPETPSAGDHQEAKPRPRPARDAKRTPPGAAAKEMPLTIELHVGIPGFAYIGQDLKDLLQRFPGAKVSPFANQTDVV